MNGDEIYDIDMGGGRRYTGNMNPRVAGSMLDMVFNMEALANRARLQAAAEAEANNIPVVATTPPVIEKPSRNAWVPLPLPTARPAPVIPAATPTLVPTAAPTPRRPAPVGAPAPEIHVNGRRLPEIFQGDATLAERFDRVKVPLVALAFGTALLWGLGSLPERGSLL